ncbi:ATP-binding response regulator [Chitinophaga nivalis]|uniref:histidine kinase n=1 Tax=Chitinophaga nivalis TaxID=2991709 RepID=A0ABT3IQ53_9BACT|nr:hybrid sensor histidine kinase/response regulator [Chitinophaga nivalis]MCW3464435.1 hybrid sensor histidine kinase/response regulator [Chitinophaga nivalis]MCW3485874.1 hybrid sensor histidine kinase/response regulator [Chitinophaga nivalis]
MNSTIIRKIRNVINNVIRTGTDGVVDEELEMRIKLVNTLSLALGSLIVVVGIIFYFLSDQLSILLPASIEFVLTLSAIWLNSRKHYLAAAIMTFGVQCLASIYFGILLNNIIELQAMIIFLISIIYLLFKERRLRTAALILTVCILLVLETYYHYQLVHPVQLSLHVSFVFRLLAMGGVLMLIILVSKPYVHSNDVNQQLKRSNHFKKIFVYQVTHELRTPLNAIYGVAQLLKREIKQDHHLQSIEPMIDQLLLASNHTRNIVNNVLDMAQIESGNSEALSSEAFEVIPFIEKIIEVNKIIAQTRNIKIKLHEVGMPGIIFSDALKLNQIITNLLGNAIKYADRNSVIDINIAGIKNQWTLQVTSKGAPIPAAKLATIFDPFITDKSKYTEGTGLGLYVVKNKVDSMNAHIQVESSTSGLTSFTITFPLRAGKPADIRLEDLADTDTTDLNNVQVMVAEDDEMSAALMSKFLKNIGCIVTITNNGAEALSASRKARPDVIIMDYHMEVMDGEETLQQLKKDPLLSNIPVIIATGDAFKESREQLLAAGANAFIEKPIDYKSLIKILHQQLHPISGELQE